jgi:CO/xanthine dehydrogenase Mo-binding subunit
VSIGAAVPRKEAPGKLTGRARYVDDVKLAGMLHGATVRSPVPRGWVRGVHFEPGVPWDEVVVVTAADIPGSNVIHLILDDQPALAHRLVNHREEPILLLAHHDRAVVERARARVRVDIEPLPAVLTMDEALAGAQTIWGQDNVFKSYAIDKGDVDAAFAAAAWVVEGAYQTGAQEQLYIEPNGVIAHVTDEGVTVWGSMQCPYYVQKALMPLFGIGPHAARVVQLETGGGFGGKEEYPSMIAAHAALLSRKAGRPVKLVYDRDEDMTATTKRHPSRTRHRTALDRDGRILALDIDFTLDGGAYATLSQVVLSRGTIHAAGPYDVANVRIRSRAVATNTPPHGAFRGFGAPQSLFALERHLDECAARAGLAPEELRRRNFVRRGGELATGQVVRDEVDLAGILDDALRRSGWHEKKARFAAANLAPGATVKRGLGLACFLHGTGFTGSGEKHLASVVGVEGTADGRIRVLTASTEIGQGTNTVFAQLAADALGIAYETVDIAQPDTREVPNSGPTVASRTVTIVGKLVESAALALRRTLVDAGLLAEPYRPADLAAAVARHVAELGPLRVTAEYHQPPEISWDEERFRGDAYGAYSWAAYVAEVAVDTVTFETRVEGFWAVQEVGKVMHPILAAGQIEGGVAQAIGWALHEEVVWKDGRMANGTMTNYTMPTSVDLPPIEVAFVESPYRHGPHGAKGIGELPMDGPAPAIVNAIRDALGGISIDRIPATPEVLMRALS